MARFLLCSSTRLPDASYRAVADRVSGIKQRTVRQWSGVDRYREDVGFEAASPAEHSLWQSLRVCSLRLSQSFQVGFGIRFSMRHIVGCHHVFLLETTGIRLIEFVNQTSLSGNLTSRVFMPDSLASFNTSSTGHRITAVAGTEMFGLLFVELFPFGLFCIASEGAVIQNVDSAFAVRPSSRKKSMGV